MEKLFSRRLWFSGAFACLALLILLMLYTTLIQQEVLPLHRVGLFGCLFVSSLIGGLLSSAGKGMRIYRALIAAVIPFALLILLSFIGEDQQGIEAESLLCSGGTCLAAGVISALVMTGKRVDTGKRRKHNFASRAAIKK